MKLYNDKANSIVLSGPIDFRHTHLNMSDITVGPKYTSTGQVGKTCKGALGYSFAAGTTDGPGDFSCKFLKTMEIILIFSNSQAR